MQFIASVTHTFAPRRYPGDLHSVVLDGEEGGVLQEELPESGLGAARDLPHLLREPPSAELAAQVVQTPEKKAGNNACMVVQED